MCFLCTMVNGAMHYMRLLGFIGLVAHWEDISSWTTLYRTAVIRNQKPILEASTESEFPESTIKYHRNCRAEFTNRRNLQTNNKASHDAATGTAPRRSPRDGNQPNSAILPLRMDRDVFARVTLLGQFRQIDMKVKNVRCVARHVKKFGRKKLKSVHWLQVFQGSHFQQIFGCPMGSPVSAILANLVMDHVEEKALSSALYPTKRWFRYVDDSHVCVKREHVDEFHAHLNSIKKRPTTNTDRYLDFKSHHHP